LPQVRLNHDALERLKVGLLAEYMHPADGSVQDVKDNPLDAILAVLGTATSVHRTKDTPFVRCGTSY
jgi:hypothetical protein